MNEVPVVREGGDITAADMVVPETTFSEIAEFYKDSTILITGATGFLGRIFLEKLLRTCNDLRRIYVLVRPKKGKDASTRFEEIFEGPSFEPLKRKKPNYVSKVTLLSGDCAQPDLGLAQPDKQRIIDEVNCIIHCAATVRFDEKLRTAVEINVRAVVDLLDIAKKAKNLRALLYVSTAFSNCIRKDIDEKTYEPPITGPKLLQLVEIFDDDKLEKIKPTLLGDFPNSYVFTKAVAESVIAEHARDLPVAIFRPSIVIASVNEPVAGWIDNYYGATGIFVGAALGLLRSLHGRKEHVADMVPADYSVNCALAATWDLATNKYVNSNRETNHNGNYQVPVYNFVSTPEAKITWDTYTKLAEKHATQVPTTLQVWNYFFSIRSSLLAHRIAVLLLHTFPAHLVDFIATCLGKKAQMVKGYEKINKFGGVISYFVCREWQFHNNTVQSLWKKMSTGDRELFEFTMSNFNWDLYFYTYVRGTRAYLLKDPLDTIPQGKVKYWKLKVAHYVLLGLLFVLAYEILRILFGLVLS